MPRKVTFMNEDGGKTKEVYFNEWCFKCENKDVDQGDDPCNDCLNNPSTAYSHKPVNFKAAS